MVPPSSSPENQLVGTSADRTSQTLFSFLIPKRDAYEAIVIQLAAIQAQLRVLADDIGIRSQAKVRAPDLEDQLRTLTAKERQLQDGLRELHVRSRAAALNGQFNKAEKLAALHDESLLTLTKLQKQTIALEVRYYRMKAPRS
jgi:hypothetical protein